MRKIILSILLAITATAALAQGPGPGPGPTPDPWVVNGSAISYNGCVLVPASVSGGCKGNGTINATAVYQAGFQVLGTLANGQIFVGNASAVGIAQTPSGDLTMTNTGVFTVSANVITNAKLAQAAATTLKGNPTNATANVQDFTLSGLSVLASPNTTLDLLLAWDHTAGTFKSVTPAALTTAVGGITALTGDVVATGPGSVAATIQPGVVTYAKFQTVAANSIVGNPTGSLATSQAISLGATLTFSGTALQTTAHTGDVTSPANSNVMTLVTAQPAAHTWAATQTFTLAPVFTDQAGSRTALGLGTAAVQNTGTSGANVPLLSGANTWGAVQTLPSPALSGTVTGNNTVPLSILQQSAANTMLGNWTGSTANVVANAMPSCADTGGNHLNYVAGTGITCGTGIGNGITALTGDVVATGPGSVAATLATVNSNVGTFGSATQSVQFTVNGKGLVTAAANVTVTPAVGSITGLGTGVATALGINVGSAGAFVVNGGALGTPASGVATNLTGTASGLTAGTVTTNANLTGDVTSVGNATTIAANAVTNAKAAQMAAYTFKGNTTGSTANATDFTISGLTNKAAPVGADLIILADSAASNATKYATLTQALGAVTSGVSSLNALTGGLTIANGNGIAAIGAVTTTITISADIASASNFYAATANKLIDASVPYTAVPTPAFSATPTFDFNTSASFAPGVLTGNITAMTCSNLKANQGGFIKLKQDGTGGRTSVFCTQFLFPNGTAPTLSTPANSVDYLIYTCETSTRCPASISKNTGWLYIPGAFAPRGWKPANDNAPMRMTG